MPPNVRFEIDDLDEEWTYSQPFDYIHTRGMNSCIADWRVFLTKVFEYAFLISCFIFAMRKD